MSEPTRSVYLVLGATDSGRREIVADLIKTGLDETTVAGVLSAVTEPGEFDSAIATGTWAWSEEGAIEATCPAGADTIFFIADGSANPVDQIEALKPWLSQQEAELIRVITVVHCGLLANAPALIHWYDACMHFSDIVLLGRRADVANKWLSDYRSRLQKLHLPYLVEMLKKGRVTNPALVLDPQVRRLSHWFDAAEDDGGWAAYVEQAEDVIIEDEAEPLDPDDAEPEDEYLACHPGGDRKMVIPDIASYL